MSVYLHLRGLLTRSLWRLFLWGVSFLSLVFGISFFHKLDHIRPCWSKNIKSYSRYVNIVGIHIFLPFNSIQDYKSFFNPNDKGTGVQKFKQWWITLTIMGQVSLEGEVSFASQAVTSSRRHCHYFCVFFWFFCRFP